MATDKTEKILKGCNAIPLPALIKYLNNGDVTLSELRNAGLASDKAKAILQLRKNDDQQAWSKALQEQSIEGYQTYIEKNPNGLHYQEAVNALTAFDEQAWLSVSSNPSEASLNSYLQQFPDGIHAVETRELLSDLPWLETKQRGTLQAYQEYQANYPDKHVADVTMAISDLSDDIDWQNACGIASTSAYQGYIDLHPIGRHTAEANQRVAAAAHREEFLAKICNDVNAYGAKEIQETVENNGASWTDIVNIFGSQHTDAIRNYSMPADLPISSPPAALNKGFTEVYFWGTPSSGKTCALGAVISAARIKGLSTHENCSGYNYMTRLSNIFNPSGFCVFPQSTSIGNIQEMCMTLRDDKKHEHRVTLIDMAGELFRSAYFKQHGLFLQAQAEQTLATALSYLNDKSNKKIHFFVVEYGAHDRVWDGLRMGDYLDNMVLYLRDEKVFSKSTDGVYVLVTKCDQIPCSPEDRPHMAYEYVQTHLLAFWNTLSETCRKAGIRDLGVIAFSVGSVFAQNLCEFDTSDTEKVIKKLIEKTRGKSDGIFSVLRN